MQMTPRQILDKLVSFPTVSRDSNLPLVDWVEEFLDSHGITAHRVWNADRTKASLYALAGPEVEGGIILSGHSDVVPVDGQDWTGDPWTVCEREQRLYGRGCADMKGFVALALAGMAQAAKDNLARPLILALSHDEELGCIAAPAMIEEIQRSLPTAAAVVVGEPTMLVPVLAHKGSYGFQVHVRGHEVHSSRMHKGVSAIMLAARLIDWANRMNAQSAVDAVASDFDPPWTTLHVGTIAGGTAENITARDCRFGLSMRVMPTDDPQVWIRRIRDEAARLEAEARNVHPDASITITATHHVPPLLPQPANAAEALMRRVLGANDGGMVSYGTEAGQFQLAGFPAIVCGPGDIAQAHQADEYISMEQFDRGWSMVQQLVATLRG
ncbi:acetylornithine deacetylase [Falsirhodobacter deserti]|uniref:acetylornithine deacetylase n=1 Tax=Falsirhodobacter deserti TaxID=1365611 RepID=UPI001F4DC611|nr:acetylornithine deacetylase [Falsirhodobacter deserti]